MVRSTRPCILLSSNGEFLERARSSVLVDHPRLAEIDQDEVGRRALLEPARGQAEQPAPGLMVMASEQRHQADLAVVVQAQRGGQQRLEADGAVGGLGEGTALGVGVLRVVARDDDVDVAGGKRRAPWPRGRPRARSGGAA